jgi:hypothetical protein
VVGKLLKVLIGYSKLLLQESKAEIKAPQIHLKKSRPTK